MRRVLLCALVAGCGSAPDLSTPELVAANAHEGDAITVEGTVFTMTFDDALGADQNYTPSSDRWILIRSAVPKGVTLEDLDSGNLLPAWGLGIHATVDELAAMTVPQIGDRVKVSGTFAKIAWGSQTAAMLPVLEDATITIESAPTVLGGVGDSCSNDMDCHDRLICDRATTKCAAPPEVLWESPYHDVNGVCSTDADCPIAQHCDLTYTVQAAGAYRAEYFAQADTGKSLCVLDADTLAAACPRIATMADLSGGRFVAGKEVCVQGTSWLALQAEDRDTHAQMALDEPLPYPLADAAYYIFGSTTENSPPYKDPARGALTVIDPHKGDTYVAVGTVRYDPSHGWWEVHPVKAYFPVAAKHLTDAEIHAQWPSHPGNLDIDELEQQWGPGEAELAQPR